jgi:hypothetical protein
VSAPNVAERVDLARCAEIAAHLAHIPAESRAEIVARFGLTWHEWEAASAWWATARDAELGAGTVELSSRFVRAFVATVERLQAQPISLSSIGPLPSTFPSEVPSPVLSPPLLDRAETEPPTVEVRRVPAGTGDLGAPSFWSPDATRGVSLAPPSLAATAGVSEVASQGMPFVPASGVAGDALRRAIAHANAVQGPRLQPPLGGDTAASSEPPGGCTRGCIHWRTRRGRHPDSTWIRTCPSQPR